MRSIAVTLALGLACTSHSPPPAEAVSVPTPAPAPTSRTVAVPGLTVTVPLAWVPEDPRQLSATRASMEAEAPAGSTVLITGMRAPDAVQAGLVYVQRMETTRDSSARPRTVRELLTRMREDLETRVVADGGTILRAAYEFDEQVAALAGCVDARMQHPERAVEVRMCMRAVYSSPTRVAMVQAMCMADDARVAAVCGPILASRQFDTDVGISLETVLPPDAPPPVPLAGVGRDRVGGVVFGMSRSQFGRACAASGFASDAIDRTREPPEMLKWFDAGLMSRCEGLPTGEAAFDVAPVRSVTVVFVDGRLAVATLVLDAPGSAVEAKLAAAYPEFVFTPARMIYRIDDEARGDELLRVGLDMPRDGGSALHFVSERGAHAPPLALP